MVYPSGHGHIVTTENLGICTLPSINWTESRTVGLIYDTVGGEIYHMEHGFRPRRTRSPVKEILLKCHVKVKMSTPALHSILSKQREWRKFLK